MICAMDIELRLYHIGGSGKAKTGKRRWEHSREQRKRRPTVYVTEAQKAPSGKGPRPKARGGAPGVICPILRPGVSFDEI